VNRNTLYIVVAVLVIVALALGYMFYQERQKTSGIDIRVDEGGITIETK
jgi:hypothetical protein